MVVVLTAISVDAAVEFAVVVRIFTVVAIALLSKDKCTKCTKFISYLARY